MSKPQKLHVTLRFGADALPVGTLATDGTSIFFEYLPAFIDRQLHLSPFMLPLRPGLQRVPNDLFRGLPGVFNDSLPDGWGRMLLHQELRFRGINPGSLGPLDELRMVGANGMGALCYHPAHPLDLPGEPVDLDRYASASRNLLEGSADDMLSELRAAAGASAGARPKVLVSVNADKSRLSTAAPLDGEEEWLIKFPGSTDTADVGAIEYVYSLMAKDAGVAMAPCHLFPAQSGAGYFGAKRFDREGGARLHMHSLSGLVHDDHRHPSFDYRSLLALTHKLTLNPNDVKAVFRVAVFNVLSHNRDDHSKNFAFLMDAAGRWSVSPAYDLTFSSGPNGYQSMSVMDEARDPTPAHLRQLGLSAGLRGTAVAAIIDQVTASLDGWDRLARIHGVSATNVTAIGNILRSSVTVRT